MIHLKINLKIFESINGKIMVNKFPNTFSFFINTEEKETIILIKWREDQFEVK